MKFKGQSSASRWRSRKAPALGAAVLLVTTLLLTVFRPTPAAKVDWMTPAQYEDLTQSSPPALPTRVLNWFRSWLPGPTRPAPPRHGVRIQAFNTTAPGGNVAPGSLPVITNADGWRGWIVPATEWQAMQRGMTSATGLFSFRPVKLPARSGGGSGYDSAPHRPSRHYHFKFRTQPAPGAPALNLSALYLSGEDTVTNVTLAFSARVAVGGAALLQRVGEHSTSHVALLAFEVLPEEAPEETAATANQ